MFACELKVCERDLCIYIGQKKRIPAGDSVPCGECLVYQTSVAGSNPADGKKKKKRERERKGKYVVNEYH